MNAIDIINRYRQLILYGIIGAACATLDFAIYTLTITIGGVIS